MKSVHWTCEWVNNWSVLICQTKERKKTSYISVCKAHKNQVAIKSNWGYYSVKENHWKLTCFPFIHLVHSNQSILNRKSHRFKSWSTVFKNFIIFRKTHYGSFKIFLSHLTEKEEFNKINKKPNYKLNLFAHQIIMNILAPRIWLLILPSTC